MSKLHKNNFMITAIAVVLVGGMVAFGYQMILHNNRVIEEFSSVDIPDDEETYGDWIRYDGTNPCPIFVEQRFDVNKSHYICMHHR